MFKSNNGINNSILWSTLFVFCGLLIFQSCQFDDTKSDNSTLQNFPSLELLSPESTGITFNNLLDDDPLGERNILSYAHYYHGGGIGMGDFDNDGLVDLFFAGNEVKNNIYKNLGNLKFQDKTSTSGINKNKNWASGVSVVDINNDGLLDIYVSQCGPYQDPSEMQNLFYINKGNFIFEEKAKEMGLHDDTYGTQAAFLDFDKDGDLDVFIINKSSYDGKSVGFIRKEIQNEEKLKRASAKLFRNNGNLTFTDITKDAGILQQSFGLGVLITDFNNDNYPDIYLANDYSVPDRMYVNQKDGTFKDQVKEYTNHISFYSMGCDAADINNDGYIDIGNVDMATSDHFRGKTLMASMDSEAFKLFTQKYGYQFQYMFNSLQLNNGNGSYSEIAGFTGLQKTDWSWAALFMDMNNDGYRDYFVSNGYKRYARDNDFRIMMEKVRQANGGSVPMDMRKDIYKKMPSIELRNLLFMNDGNLGFEKNPKTFGYPDVGTYSYGSAYGDLDNDGDLELVVNNIDSPAHIIKNNSRENKLGNYITIKLKHPNNTSLVYNAKVKISYGDQIQVAEYAFVRGYQSSMDQRVLFGLGKSKKIDKIEILWNDDNLQTINNPTINTEVLITYQEEKKGSFDFESTKTIALTEVTPAEIGLNYRHEENEFEDFAKEILLPQKQSTLGPALTVTDFNGDGLDDIFCGGGKGQKSQFYTQNKDGSFDKMSDTYFNIDKNTEDLDAIFVDPNKDGKKELIIASGGGGDMEGEIELLHDRFYVNVNGTFSKVKNVIPGVSSSSYRMISGDLNNDGAEDVLIFGSARPGKYPLSEKNRVLSYTGKSYEDVTDQLIPEIKNVPLVRDAIFEDFNQDGIDDILLVSEWGSPKIFVSSDGKYKEATSDYFKEDKFGWWASITPVDIDNDGDMDFILGNMGKNLKHKVSNDHPLFLYANDFDKNGTLDVVLAKEYKGKIVPARGRECSSEQMPFITEKFETYASFANADIVDILGEKSVNEAQVFKATTFGSYLLRNNQGVFDYEELPVYCQIAPVSGGVVVDLNDDGYQDVILAGNYYDTEYETPRQDAGRGVVLINNQGKNFKALTPSQSGLDLDGNFRKIQLVQRKNDQLIVAAENNGPLKIYKIK